MSKSNFWENAILNLLFNATAIANIADNAVSSPLTQLFVALHTADPGEGGNQSTSEISYTGYARIGVNRNSGGWVTATTGSTGPVANIVFGTMSGGAGGTVTFASIGVASGGATNILYSGSVTPSIVVTNSVQPILTTSSTITED